MKLLLYLLCIVGAILALLWLLYLICFYHTPQGDTPFSIPGDDQTHPVRKKILAMEQECHTFPFQRIYTESEDGLLLAGKFYAYDKTGDQPLILFFHGYHSCSIPDGVGLLYLCRKMGWDILLAEQRAHGSSQGRFLSFGEKEKRDCICWVKEMQKRFPGKKLCLSGVSMGAATVLLTAGEADLPSAVCCVAADCGYGNTEDVLRHVIRHRHLSSGIVFFLLRLGARLFGGFDPKHTSPEQALTKAKIPVLLTHGEEDRFVPCHMGRKMFAAAKDVGVNVQLYTTAGAGHALSYVLDPEAYTQKLLDFWKDTGLICSAITKEE